MHAESDRVVAITLADLAPEDTNHMLADTLQLTAADCRDLGHVLIEKSAGNPLFFRQLLNVLESNRLLRFVRASEARLRSVERPTVASSEKVAEDGSR